MPIGAALAVVCFAHLSCVATAAGVRQLLGAMAMQAAQALVGQGVDVLRGLLPALVNALVVGPPAGGSAAAMGCVILPPWN